jgi:YgiT-type zinc finger domain-containing protein
MTPIRTCPICGSKRVKREKQNLQFKTGGKETRVQDVAVDHCLNCGETFLDHEASQRVDEVIPKRRVARRRSA